MYGVDGLLMGMLGYIPFFVLGTGSFRAGPRKVPLLGILGNTFALICIDSNIRGGA